MSVDVGARGARPTDLDGLPPDAVDRGLPAVTPPRSAPSATDPLGAVSVLRHQVADLTRAQHDLTEVLITTQDRLAALSALTRVNVDTLGHDEAETSMLREALTLTDSDCAVLVHPAHRTVVGLAACADALADAAVVGLDRPPGPATGLADGTSYVVARLPDAEPAAALALGRVDGPPYSTGDLELVQAVVDALAMMARLTRLHVDAVRRATVEREHQAASALAQALSSTAVPDLPGVQLFASTVPAHRAGGDVVVVDEVDGVVWFAVGDVAGKGLPAAIVMTRAVSAARVAFLRGAPEDPAAALSAVGDELYDYLSDVGLFVTMVLGAFDPRSGALRLCNAGHSPVMTVRGREVVDIPPSTPPLGVVPGVTGRTVTEVLHPGDALVLGSDGLAEQADPAGALLGYEALARVCREGTTGAAALGRRILETVAGHAQGTPASDDTTLVVLSAGSVGA